MSAIPISYAAVFLLFLSYRTVTRLLCRLLNRRLQILLLHIFARFYLLDDKQAIRFFTYNTPLISAWPDIIVKYLIEIINYLLSFAHIEVRVHKSAVRAFSPRIRVTFPLPAYIQAFHDEYMHKLLAYIHGIYFKYYTTKLLIPMYLCAATCYYSGKLGPSCCDCII